MFECKLTNEDLIFRLSRGLFTLNDGHIYFDNQVWKIRYDLTDQVNNLLLKEEDIFEHYPDILNIGSTMKILAQMPIDSI